MTAQIFILGAHPRARPNALEAVRLAPDGKVVRISDRTRTLEQNAKLWAMLSEISEQVEWYDQKLTPDDWKTVFTASLRKARVVPGLDAGTLVPLGLSTSQMTVAEMSALIELISAFAAEHGVEFSPACYP